MCTVTFIARQNGYCLGMNRDEKLTRPTGLPPKKEIIDGRTVLSPSEPGGGTWIAVNQQGATFSLINWYAIPLQAGANAFSRGAVVNSVRTTDAPEDAERLLSRLSLNRINAFRLIGVFPRTQEIAEWRWNLKQLVRKRCSWETQQWISSGFDEPKAQHQRDRTFQQALQQRSSGRVDWLRRLHRCHAPESGPFSTCMHRSDAATVSYTEIIVSTDQVAMRYHAGAPCRSRPVSEKKMARL